MADFKETAFNHIEGDEMADFSTRSKKWINRINMLSKKFPDKCRIRHKNPDGSILAEFPEKWFKINPGRRVSDKQKEKLRKNIRKAREKKEEKQ